VQAATPLAGASAAAPGKPRFGLTDGRVGHQKPLAQAASRVQNAIDPAPGVSGTLNLPRMAGRSAPKKSSAM